MISIQTEIRQTSPQRLTSPNLLHAKMHKNKKTATATSKPHLYVP